VHGEEESTLDEESADVSGTIHHIPAFKKPRVANLVNQNDSETDSSHDETNDSERESESDTDTTEGDKSLEEDESSSELEDNTAYQDWREEAKETTQEMWSAKYEKYIDEGMSEDHAKEKADIKTLWAVKRNFFNNYKDFLSSYLHLKDNDIHQEIVEELEEKMEKNMDVNKALSRVISKYQPKFNGLFQQDEENDVQQDEENDDD
jgi:hypothetical protein